VVYVMGRESAWGGKTKITVFVLKNVRKKFLLGKIGVYRGI